MRGQKPPAEDGAGHKRTIISGVPSGRDGRDLRWSCGNLRSWHTGDVTFDPEKYPMGRVGIRTVGLVANPRAGRGRASHATDRAVARLTERGVSVVAVQGRDTDATRRLLAGLVADDRIDALVVVGGDGMVNLALQAQAGTGLPLGIIPAGTGNDHAREHRLPGSPEDAADVVADGFTIATDLGRITADDGTSRWFGTVMCSGFDSLVSDRVNRMSWPPGRSRYHMAIAAELVHLRPMPLRITLDDGTVLDAPVTLAAFGNTRSYGGGMAICPSADHADGLLDLTVIGEASRAKAVWTLSKLFSGDHVNFDEVTVHRTRSARVEYLGVGDHCSYADGDAMATLPVTVEAVPAVGRYIVPQP